MSVSRPHAEPQAGVKRDRRTTAEARLRSCVACRKTAEPAELTRWVFAGDGTVLPDLGQGAFGRGAWLHPHVQCLKQARAGFSKAFKAPISSSPAELAVLLGSAAERRAAALLSAAQRSRKLVVGKTAVEKELSSGACRLLVIATDAKSAAGSREVAQVIASGGAVSWGTKTGLGGLVGRMEAGVLAVMDDGLANALKKTIAMAQSASLASSGTGSGAGQGLHRVIEQEARVEKECSTEVG